MSSVKISRFHPFRLPISACALPPPPPPPVPPNPASWDGASLQRQYLRDKQTQGDPAFPLLAFLVQNLPLISVGLY